MGDPQPRQVDKKDYVWCEACKVYIPKKFLKPYSGFFSGEEGVRCPEGHIVVVEEPKGA